jgi:hypothetical protein
MKGENEKENKIRGQRFDLCPSYFISVYLRASAVHLRFCSTQRWMTKANGSVIMMASEFHRVGIWSEVTRDGHRQRESHVPSKSLNYYPVHSNIS